MAQRRSPSPSGSSSSGTSSGSSGSDSSGSSRSRSPTPRKDKGSDDKPMKEQDEGGANGKDEAKEEVVVLKEEAKQPQPADDATTRLVVGNLTRNVSEDHVREIFSLYGTIKSVDLAFDKAVNLPRGFAHVEYDVVGDAQKAIDYMNGAQIDGKVIRVNFMILPKKREPEPRKEAPAGRPEPRTRSPLPPARGRRSPSPPPKRRSRSRSPPPPRGGRAARSPSPPPKRRSRSPLRRGARSPPPGGSGKDGATAALPGPPPRLPGPPSSLPGPPPALPGPPGGGRFPSPPRGGGGSRGARLSPPPRGGGSRRSPSPLRRRSPPPKSGVSRGGGGRSRSPAPLRRGSRSPLGRRPSGARSPARRSRSPPPPRRSRSPVRRSRSPEPKKKGRFTVIENSLERKPSRLSLGLTPESSYTGVGKASTSGAGTAPSIYPIPEGVPVLRDACTGAPLPADAQLLPRLQAPTTT
ncbi:hypothetical protein FOA52_004675 [Chlamydomonas sp. UWO 241]|nr:hypothetical protein FOA52_004675 [Chlamydomonas sp. UWO 241]